MQIEALLCISLILKTLVKYLVAINSIILIFINPTSIILLTPHGLFIQLMTKYKT